MKGKKTKPLDILLVVNMFLTGFDSKLLVLTLCIFILSVRKNPGNIEVMLDPFEDVVGI